MKNADAGKTGFPSIDKPWDTYYRKTPLRSFDIEQKPYKLIFDTNSQNMDEPALYFLGTLLTYRDLKLLVDKAANSFSLLGIKENDVVTVSLINMPGTAVIFLALNKIGAVSNWLDVRTTGTELIREIKGHDSRVLITFDLLLPRVEEIIDDTSLSHVLVLSPGDDISPLKRIGYKLTKRPPSLPKDERYINYKDFLNLGDHGCEAETALYQTGETTVIIQSSGTTGLAKSIMHSDYSLNQSTRKLSYSDYPCYPGTRMLMVIPPWVAYGLINTLYFSLMMGMTVVMAPDFEPDAVSRYIGKFELAMAAPFHYRYLVDHADLLKDMSTTRGLISGGDKMDSEEIGAMRGILATKNYKGDILNGYGTNEVLGVATVNPFEHNRPGSVGVPLWGNVVTTIDPETGQEQAYGETGELCILTETAFMGYTGLEKETAEVKRQHPDGSHWIHTADLGRLDQDGYIYVEGRLRRLIIRRGFKIFPGTIEKVISAHASVKACYVVGTDDPVDKHAPFAFVVKNDRSGSEEALRLSILDLCADELMDFEQPVAIEFIDALPYTDNNKVDFRKLEEWGNASVQASQ